MPAAVSATGGKYDWLRSCLMMMMARCKCEDGQAGEWCQQNTAKADEETCARLSPCILSTIFADSNDVDESQKVIKS